MILAVTEPKRLAAGVCTAFLLGVATPAPAAVPQYMNYQGLLLDQAGDPLPTAEYVLQFEVYDAPSGGNLIWGPQVFDGAQGSGHGEMVVVVKGHFNVILGPSDTTSRSLSTAFAGQTRYIEVKFRRVADPGLTTISPRQQILSAPFSLRAGDADTVRGDDLLARVLALQDEVNRTNARINGLRLRIAWAGYGADFSCGGQDLASDADLTFQSGSRDGTSCGVANRNRYKTLELVVPSL